MRLFNDQETTREILGAHRKWQRTLEAVSGAPDLPAGVMYSIGESLTYMRDQAASLATPYLVGRRRYHFVVAALTEGVCVEVAPKSELTAEGPYDNLSDRQPFTGSGQVVQLSAGALLIVDIDEAARILPTPASEAVLLHVTVEGATFHNK